MYCRPCNIHFSELETGGRCPSCGRNGGSAPVEGGIDIAASPRKWGAGHEPRDAAPAGPSAPRPAAVSSGIEEPTRTERFSPERWAPGSRVAGKYEVVGPLGSGGFGTVYKVRHIFRKKYYALKTPHPQFVEDEVFRRRFEREIEAMERFVHADAVMIRDCGLTEHGLPYYTMDFIEGESLKAVLAREGRLPAERTLGIVRRVLRVLEVAHEHRIIHRDIKPDNILLTRGGGREQVKVLDFGVAKLLDLVGWTSITQDARVGTPRYMSPEQITGEPADPRSDLFSLGIIFFECLTGEHPFTRERDPVRVTAAILNRAPPSPRDLVPELPRSLSEKVLWMLEKRPRRRPASARAVLEALPQPGDERAGPGGDHSSLEVYEGAPRLVLDGLTLSQAGPEGERRSFLLLGGRVDFGRSAEFQGRKNQLVLRLLPCRSEELDPENWRRNLTISQRLGSLSADGSAILFEPDPQSRGGVAINGVRSPRPGRIQADRFHLTFGDRALEIDGHRRLRRSDRAELDLGFLQSGRPAGDPRPAVSGYSHPEVSIDHVHLERASNHPLHEYFLVFRQLPVGSAPDSGLRLLEEGIEEEHALIVFEGGEAFVAASEGEVRISRPSAAPVEGPTVREEVSVPSGTLYPLVPGIEVLLGPARLRVDALDPESYKRV
jgi:serine/threonine protein kinase